jgi:hypothetical protein
MPFPDGLTVPGYPEAMGLNVSAVTSAASNVYTGTNPEYTAADFAAIYPQFGSVVPAGVVTMYIGVASARVCQARVGSDWPMLMALVIAHFCTLWLRSATPSGASAKAVLAAGEAHGLTTQESAGPVSFSVDYDAVGRDLDGWAMWKETEFGRQFATLVKPYGLGGMMVL